MEQTLERVWRDGLKWNFNERGLPSFIQFRLEIIHRRSVQNLLWQFSPVREYLEAESMLAASGVTPLLVKL